MTQSAPKQSGATNAAVATGATPEQGHGTQAPNEKAGDAIDPMEDQPIRCELEMDAFGLIRLTRGPGCTLLDALDLCVHMISGGYRVLDVTPTEPNRQATSGPSNPLTAMSG